MKKENTNYKFIFNKIFTGSYLIYNLGNELLNFIKTDDNGTPYGNKRLIYINPYGNRGNNAVKECEYVLHIMKVTFEGENYYELVAVSKINNNKKTHYNTDTEAERKAYLKDNIEFNGYPLGDIFSDKKSHLCSFIAEKFYTVKKGVHILFKTNSKTNKNRKKINQLDKSTIIINISCNPNRSMCYSKESDVSTLEEIINKKYLKEDNDTINLDKYNDEQCLAVISDRTNLEDSTSNQIAYFLNRDKLLLSRFIKFINKNLKKGQEKIDTKTEFEILREKEHIDIMLKNKDYLIIIENKIDSHINGVKETKARKKESQLSSYYNYATKNKDLNEITNKYFFILVPRYNSITQEKLEKEYKNGDKYTIIYYDNLYDEVLKNYTYSPYGKTSTTPKEQFLFEQFKEGIKYIKSTKAEQMKETAYIRLKQKINELEKR